MDAQIVLGWVEVIVAIVFLVVPLAVAAVKLTAWGRANRDALDEVVDAVAHARRSTRSTDTVLQVMKAKEPATKPRVVRAWKNAVRRRQPARPAANLRGDAGPNPTGSAG